MFRSPRLPDGSFREAARYLLGFRLPDELSAESDIIRATSEIAALPLRLRTEGSITLSPAAVSRRPLKEILDEGCESRAVIVQEVQLWATLSRDDCAKIESNLPYLKPPLDMAEWQALAVTFTEAYYKPDLTEQGLAFLVALETLVTPSVRKRSRASSVQHYGALLAATEKSEQRHYTKLLRNAYEQRDVLRHGEADGSRIVKARQWLSQHWKELRDICRRAFQRALWLRNDGILSVPSGITAFIETEKAQASLQIWGIPIVTVGHLAVCEYLDLSRDFRVETTGSGSVHFNV